MISSKAISSKKMSKCLLPFSARRSFARTTVKLTVVLMEHDLHELRIHAAVRVERNAIRGVDQHRSYIDGGNHATAQYSLFVLLCLFILRCVSVFLCLGVVGSVFVCLSLPASCPLLLCLCLYVLLSKPISRTVQHWRHLEI